MTTPLERLIAAVRAHCGADECGGLAELRAALAALPATPPEQPVLDAERERAIEEWRERSEHMMTAQEGARWVLDGVALMRSAPAPQPVRVAGKEFAPCAKCGTLCEEQPVPAPQPGTITCKCGAVATLLPIDCKSSVGWIGCAKCGHELMRWGPQPVPEEQPDDLGVMRDAKGLSERCRELRDRLVRLAQPVPAPPASDWRTDLGVTGNIGTGTVLP